MEKEKAFKILDSVVAKYPNEHRALLLKYTGVVFSDNDLKEAILVSLNNDKDYMQEFDLLVSEQVSANEDYFNFWGAVLSLGGSLLQGSQSNKQAQSQIEIERIRLQREKEATNQKIIIGSILGGVVMLGLITFAVIKSKKNK